ncbi:Cyclic nucleotide-binding domain-containing protein 2 [Boothiomyces sp. JEL0838]|nr:Cyclic nucleotide-binding domain-containing protein 2 [Boothiomyces sp. JEL0838]
MENNLQIGNRDNRHEIPLQQGMDSKLIVRKEKSLSIPKYKGEERPPTVQDTYNQPKSRRNSNNSRRNTMNTGKQNYSQNGDQFNPEELPTISKNPKHLSIDRFETKTMNLFQKCEDFVSDSKLQLPQMVEPNNNRTRKESALRKYSLDSESSSGENSNMLTEKCTQKDIVRQKGGIQLASKYCKDPTSLEDTRTNESDTESFRSEDCSMRTEERVRRPRKKSTLQSLVLEKNLESITASSNIQRRTALVESNESEERASITSQMTRVDADQYRRYSAGPNTILTNETRPRRNTAESMNSEYNRISQYPEFPDNSLPESIRKNNRNEKLSKKPTFLGQVNSYLESRNTMISKYERFKTKKQFETSERPKMLKPVSRLSKRCWLYVYNIHSMYHKLGKAYKAISNSHFDRISAYPLKDSGLLTYILKSQVITPNQSYINQVKQLLSEPQFKRSSETIQTLEKLLYYRIPGFAKFQSNQRTFICQAVTLESHPKRTVLMKEGGVGCCFYFVIAGQVELVRINEGYNFRLDMMNSGNIFGDECLVLEDIKRLYTAVTTEYSILLRVDKDDFVQYTGSGEARELKDLIYRVLSESIFKGFEEALQHMLNSNFFHVYNYSKNSVIVEQGSQITEMQFIIEGSCKVTRLLPFIKSSFNKAILQPCTFEDMHEPLYTTVKVDTQDLFQGAHYPTIPKLFTDQEVMTESEFTKNLYYDLYNNFDPQNHHIYHKYGIIADENVQIASMRIQDFIHMAPKVLLYRMIMQPSVELYDAKELQLKYLSQVDWNEKKQEILKVFMK